VSERIPMTRGGFEKLEAELVRLKTVDRPHNVQEIAEARAHGDISENAEFHAAKERQSHLEARILQVEDRIARAQIIEPGVNPPDAVRFGTTVVLEDTDSGRATFETLAYDAAAFGAPRRPQALPDVLAGEVTSQRLTLDGRLRCQPAIAAPSAFLTCFFGSHASNRLAFDLDAGRVSSYPPVEVT